MLTPPPAGGHRRSAYGLWAIPLAFMLMYCVASAGVALRLYYDDIPEKTVGSLTSNSAFPGKPSRDEVVTEALERIGRGKDDYGSWIRGYLEAPQTGDYLFWISSDDASELRLSTNHLAAGLRKIAEVLGHVGVREFDVKSGQRSQPVRLVRGEKYYFELFHKNTIGYDHVSVGWQLPDGTLQRPIPVERLMPFPVDENYRPIDKAPVVLKDYLSVPVQTLGDVSAFEGENVNFAVTVDGTQPVAFQWFRNNKPIPGAILSSLTITNVQLSNDGERVSVVASNRLGKTSSEAALYVFGDTNPPVVTGVFNLGVSNALAVVFSKPVGTESATFAGNYAIDRGVSVIKAARGANPNTVLLTISTPLTADFTYTLAISNVKDLSAAAREVAPGHRVAIEKDAKLWLKFDEKTPEDLVEDFSGNNHFAALLHGARIDPAGVIGACLKLDGVNDHALLPPGFADFTTGMTVAVWARLDKPKLWSRFLDLGNGAAKNNILFAREAITKNLAFEVYNDRVLGRKALATNAIDLGVWQHFAVSLDQLGNVHFYKNGKLIRQSITRLPEVIERKQNFIGRSNWPTDEYLQGMLDDLRIYSRALSSTEIKALIIAGERP